jgi:hypothetical protein
MHNHHDMHHKHGTTHVGRVRHLLMMMMIVGKRHYALVAARGGFIVVLT